MELNLNLEVFEWVRLHSSWLITYNSFFFCIVLLKLLLIIPRQKWRLTTALVMLVWIVYGGLFTGFYCWFETILPVLTVAGPALWSYIGFGILLLIGSYYLSSLGHRNPGNKIYIGANKVLLWLIISQLILYVLGTLVMLCLLVGLNFFLIWLICVSIFAVFGVKLMLWFKHSLFV